MLGFGAIGEYALGQVQSTTYLTAEAGAFALTGQAVSFTASLPAQAGSYVLTGQAALFATTFVAAPGSFTFTGQAAGLTPSLVCGAGSFVLTGQDAQYIETRRGGGSDKRKLLKKRKRKLPRTQDEPDTPAPAIDLPLFEHDLPPIVSEPPRLPIQLSQPPAWLASMQRQMADEQDALAIVALIPDPADIEMQMLARDAQDLIDIRAILQFV